MSAWKDEIVRIHQDAFAGRKKIKPWSDEDMRFLSLALCGEAGELANWVKKEWRGDSISYPEFWHKAAAELADCVIYLHLLATALSVDIDQMILDKLPEIRAKFNAPEIKASPPLGT